MLVIVGALIIFMLVTGAGEKSPRRPPCCRPQAVITPALFGLTVVVTPATVAARTTLRRGGDPSHRDNEISKFPILVSFGLRQA